MGAATGAAAAPVRAAQLRLPRGAGQLSWAEGSSARKSGVQVTATEASFRDLFACVFACFVCVVCIVCLVWFGVVMVLFGLYCLFGFLLL